MGVKYNETVYWSGPSLIEQTIYVDFFFYL